MRTVTRFIYRYCVAGLAFAAIIFPASSSIAADLQIGLVNMSPSDGILVPGQSFYYAVMATSTGEPALAEGTTSIHYYISDNAFITAGDTVLHPPTTINTDDIPTGYGVDVTAPSTPGTYYVGACIDLVPDDSDPNNNCTLGREITEIKRVIYDK